VSADPDPTRFEQFKQRQRTTLRLTFDRQNVKRTAINGVRMTFLNTAAMMGSNFLNAYMTTHGMHTRVFTISLQPNPYQDVPQNPRKRSTGSNV
jgi:hypothetical protein